MHVAYWADAEANSMAIQLLWPRVPAWHTSAHCEGLKEFLETKAVMGHNAA